MAPVLSSPLFVRRSVQDHKKLIGGLFVLITLTFGSGCAKTDWIDPTLVTESVTGVWAGSMVSPDGQPMIRQGVRLELQQEGAKVIGSFEGSSTGSFVGQGSAPIEGSEAGDVFRFDDARGTVNGELTVSAEEMTGHGVFGIRPVTITLRRVQSAQSPTSPPH
jgi:hypothetical protein